MCPDGYVYNIEVEEHHNYFADGVLVHNCHHSCASSYVKLLHHYCEDQITRGDKAAKVLGLTATPTRADGKGLGDIFDALFVVRSFKELAADGHLVIPVVRSSPLNINLDSIKSTGGDYNLGQLEAAVNTFTLVGNIARHWQKYAENRSTIVFAAGVEHSKNIVAEFISIGVSAEHLDGSTPTDERAAILERFHSGQTTVVSNMGVLTEGFDEPRAKCIIIARPTKSLSLFLQMAGRGLRPWNGVSALLLDHGDCINRHGFPHQDRKWSLHSTKVKGKGPAPSKTCPECEACVPIGESVCPACGYAFPPKPLSVVDGELVEVKLEEAAEPAGPSLADRREWYENMLAVTVSRAWKKGAARHKYKEKYGDWPYFNKLEAKYFPKIVQKPPTPTYRATYNVAPSTEVDAPTIQPRRQSQTQAQAPQPTAPSTDTQQTIRPKWQQLVLDGAAKAQRPSPTQPTGQTAHAPSAQAPKAPIRQTYNYSSNRPLSSYCGDPMDDSDDGDE